MPVIFRTIAYASAFVALVLIYVPARFLAWSGIVRPANFEFAQIAGLAIGTIGAVIALWCVATFSTIGKGTPAPFDPPRRLVVRGPYRFVRNPMYIGAGTALAGAAAFYQSLALLLYTAIFFIACELFVLLYEEPHLRRAFGQEYDLYCHGTRRWLPHF